MHGLQKATHRQLRLCFGSGRHSLEVALEGFHPVRRAGLVVGGGDRVNIGALTLAVGSASES
jgi:hypothetical protein